MAELMFISETGWFHTACRVTLGGRVEWYGFKPRQHRSPHGPGMVDRSDRSGFVNHSITFDFNEVVLQSAVETVARDYANKIYCVIVRDCISFTADVARRVMLRVPSVNITPYGFIQELAFRNVHKSTR